MIDIHHFTDFVGLETLKPIAFNPWKHHRGFVCQQLAQIRNTGSYDLSIILSNIGGTLLDFYLGELTPEQIADEIVKHLRLLGVVNFSEFEKWLGIPQNLFKSISLSDGSRWVVRLGYRSDYYIHIHPGRYSSLTCRCRPSGLKVAIAFRYLFGFNVQTLDIERVNRARAFVGLCPINSVNKAQAFLKILHVLEVK